MFLIIEFSFSSFSTCSLKFRLLCSSIPFCFISLSAFSSTSLRRKFKFSFKALNLKMASSCCASSSSFLAIISLKELCIPSSLFSYSATCFKASSFNAFVTAIKSSSCFSFKRFISLTFCCIVDFKLVIACSLLVISSFNKVLLLSSSLILLLKVVISLFFISTSKISLERKALAIFIVCSSEYFCLAKFKASKALEPLRILYIISSYANLASVRALLRRILIFSISFCS